jgi:hypothetical protein
MQNLHVPPPNVLAWLSLRVPSHAVRAWAEQAHPDIKGGGLFAG